MCVRVMPVPSQGRDQPCICVLESCLYLAQEESSHVYVCQGHACTLPMKRPAMYMCVRVIPVPSQGRDQPCICVLGPCLYLVKEETSHVYVCQSHAFTQQRKRAAMYMCVRVMPVPSQGREQPCICVLGSCLFLAKEETSHVYVCQSHACTQPRKRAAKYLCVRVMPVPSQGREQPCICVLGSCLYLAKEEISHVYVCQGHACTLTFFISTSDRYIFVDVELYTFCINNSRTTNSI